MGTWIDWHTIVRFRFGTNTSLPSSLTQNRCRRQFVIDTVAIQSAIHAEFIFKKNHTSFFAPTSEDKSVRTPWHRRRWPRPTSANKSSGNWSIISLQCVGVWLVPFATHWRIGCLPAANAVDANSTMVFGTRWTACWARTWNPSRATPHPHTVSPWFPICVVFIFEMVTTRPPSLKNWALISGKYHCLNLCGRVSDLASFFSIRSSYGGSGWPCGNRSLARSANTWRQLWTSYDGHGGLVVPETRGLKHLRQFLNHLATTRSPSCSCAFSANVRTLLLQPCHIRRVLVSKTGHRSCSCNHHESLPTAFWE